MHKAPSIPVSPYRCFKTGWGEKKRKRRKEISKVQRWYFLSLFSYGYEKGSYKPKNKQKQTNKQKKTHQNEKPSLKKRERIRNKTVNPQLTLLIRRRNINSTKNSASFNDKEVAGEQGNKLTTLVEEFMTVSIQPEESDCLYSKYNLYYGYWICNQSSWC